MISVVIPVYNAESVIEECLKSLLSQEYMYEIEIIVIDDGSTDNTSSIVKKYPVILLEQKNKGPASARNLGAKKSKSDIVLFTDADCVPDKFWVSEMVKPFNDKEVVGVQGVYKTNQKELIAKFSQLEIETRYDRMFSRDSIDFIGSYSAGYRKNIFLENDGFYEGFKKASGEDPDLSFRLSDKGYRLVINPNAVVYHKHPNNIVKYLKQKFYRAYWRNLLYKRNKSKMVTESYTNQSLKIQIISFYLIILSLIIYSPVSILFIILLILSTLKESYKNFRKDKMIGLISPLILILRSISFSLGLVIGMIKLNILNRS